MEAFVGLIGSLTVGEACFKQIVVSSGDLCDDFCQARAFLIVEVDKSSLVCLRNDHNLKRPGCPPGASSPETLVFENSPLTLLALEFCVVLQHVAIVVFPAVLLQVLKFDARFLWQ